MAGPAASWARVALTAVRLHQFRTYSELELQLPAGIVAFAGPNGVGKTNLLEALAIGTQGASPRTSAEARCIRHGAGGYGIGVQAEVDGETVRLQASYGGDRSRKLTVDAQPVASQGAFAATAPSVVFLPERLLVVRGAPARRRGTLDRLVQRIRPAAVAPMREYGQAVAQRNALLRRLRAGAGDAMDELAVWDQGVVELGMRVRTARAAALEVVAPRFAVELQGLTGMEEGSVRIHERGPDLAAALADRRQLDRRMATTGAGPHLDEISFVVGERDLRNFGSTGEQRAALLAWTFAEAHAVREADDADPVLLLDEPYAELDAERRERLTERLARAAQAFLTTTEPAAIVRGAAPATITTMQVEPGRVIA